MEDVTMERLLNDLAGVIAQINDIVVRKDIKQARTVLEQVAELVSNGEHVALDDRENYDHALHELLSKITGVIEIIETRTRDDVSTTKKWGPLSDVEIDDAIQRGFDEYTPGDGGQFDMFLQEHGHDPAKLKDEYDKGKSHSTKKGEEVVRDRLDLEAEAKKIGDYIFKTAEIRKTLEERGFTREDYLKHYKAGITQTEELIKKIEEDYNKVVKEYGSIYLDENGKNIPDLVMSKDTSNDEKIKLVEKIRQKAQGVESIKSKLEGYDTPITTMEQAEKFFKYIEAQTNAEITALKTRISDQQENKVIFQDQIRIIENELDAIKKGDDKNVIARGNNEKKLRAELIRASMFGNEKLEQEWAKRVTRLYSNKITSQTPATYEHKNPDGSIEYREVLYDTIKDYPEQADDAYFLNLEDYKKYLEITSIYDNAEGKYGKGAGLDAMKKVMNMSGQDFEDYHKLKATDPNAADEWLKNLIAEKKEYVKTFHGFTNEKAVKYTALKSAGTTLKYMMPVTGNLPATQKASNAVGNFFRFFGIRAPHFSEKNARGEKIKTPGKGIATLATDAVALGVLGAAIAGGPLTLATWGAAYTVKGAVTAANMIAAKAEYKKYKNVIDANLPTLASGHGSKNAREEARKDFYRREMQIHDYGAVGNFLLKRGDKLSILGKTITKAKSMNDRIFTRKRAKKTEEKIVEERIALSDAVIDQRTAQAAETAKRNIEIALINQQNREYNRQQETMSARSYNEIVRDPYKVNMEETEGIIARNAAIRLKDPDRYGSLRSDINPNSDVEIKGKYVKEDEINRPIHEMLQYKERGGTIASTAVTEDQVYRGRVTKQDRINRFWQTTLTMAAKVGIDYLGSGFREAVETTTPGTPDKTQTTPGSRKWVDGKEQQVPNYVDQTTTQVNPSKKLLDYDYSTSGEHDIYFNGQISAGNPDMSHINGLAIRVPKQDGSGNIIEISLAKNGTGITSKHVHSFTDKDIGSMGYEDVLNELKVTDPANYNMALSELGLNPGCTAEEFMKALAKVGGKTYSQENVEGWREMADMVETVTQKVQDGFTTIKTPGHWVNIPGKTTIIPGTPSITTTTYKFNPGLIAMSSAEGAAAGAIPWVIDAAHEAANKTKRMPEGTFEERTPKLLISKLANLEAERRKKEREANEKKKNSGDKGDR